MNGQNTALGNFFVDIGQFLPLLTVKIKSNNFTLSNNARQTKSAKKG